MTRNSALPRTYRIRPGRMTAVYVAAGLGLPGALLPVYAEESAPGWVKWLLTWVVLGLLGWIVVAARNLSTTADGRGIHVRGFVRRRRIAWADVQDIRAVPNPSAGMGQGQPQVISYAYGRDGRRLQLFYVDDNHVPVEREIEVLRAAWERLRGEDWTEDAGAARRIERREGLERRFVPALFLAFGAEVVLGVLLLVLSVNDVVELPMALLVVAPVATFFGYLFWPRLRGRA
ncbi:PH domain-containing protein [Streptomyces sp. NPDC088090]|uniref:PH domain-containing protein n=1 Tax=Streptomyces sp. NPDC088090 TaxID=3365822 RepID=UPI00385155C5